MRRAVLLAIFSIALTACQTPERVVRTWEVPPGVKVAIVNGYDMAYVERGSGVPVIFVHGAGVDYRYFAAQMEPFATKYRAIAVSLRRYYPEPWRGEGEFSLNQQVADLVVFIRNLGGGPVHLVGHSRGGTVALYATSAAPELIRTLTLAEGGVGMKAFSPDDASQRERRTAAYGSMLDKLSKGDTDGALEVFVTYVNGPSAWKSTPEATKQSLRDNAWTFPAADKDEARWPPFSCDDAKRITTPVLLLRADGSPANFGQVLDKVQPCFQRAQRGLISNSSHAMPRMNPAGFNTAVLAFIDAH